MIFVTHRLPANQDSQSGEVAVNRRALWDGLVLKANNALPFVAAMSTCTVTHRLSETVFDRDVEVRGQPHSERVTLEEPHRVVFTRTAGPVLGTIANEIEEEGGELFLRFSFALVITGVEGGSPQEREYADGMTADYLQAVASTLEAVRKVVRGDPRPA